MKINILSLSAVILLFAASCSSENGLKVTSPDGRLSVSLYNDRSGMLCYNLVCDGDTLIMDSHLGFECADNGYVPSASWDVESSTSSHDGVWKPVWGKRSKVVDRYNELSMTFRSPKGHNGVNSINVVFRAYDDGIAFRYVVPDEAFGTSEVLRETTSYGFSGDFTSWFYNGEHHNLGPDRLSEVDGVRHPVMTVKASDEHYLAIHESDLTEGQPLVLSSQKGSTIFNVSSHPSTLHPGYSSAWRVIFHGSTPGEMVDSHLIELLSPEAEGDFSWVKPSIAVWDWRINGAVSDDGFKYGMDYPSWVRMVDFASEQGFGYLVLDANWYGPEFESDSNPLTGDKVNDVKRIISYGKEKGVGIWLYLNDVGGRKYPVEKTLKQYGEWGAAGVKYGFMRGNAEEKNQWTRKITRLCAENRLLVDFHDGPVHPYGQMRTWPNAVTREFCHAQLDAHRVFEPKTFVTTVFVNMLAGPLDMNNGMFDLRQGHTTRVDENQPVPSTIVAEAARTLITFSGVTILPDIPEMYRKYPSLLRFLSSQKMPWLESKTLAGEIGKYIVMMRETEDAYLIAAANNETERELSVPLNFLPEGNNYNAVIIEDGDDAHYLLNRESLKERIVNVEKNDKLKIRMAEGGGTCIVINKN